MQTIDVVGKYVVRHDQELVFNDQPAFTFQYNDEKPDTLVNAGSVLINDARDNTYVHAVTSGFGAYGPHNFDNRAGASFVLHATGQFASAFGIQDYGSIHNEGYFEVTASQSYAEGFSTGGDFANAGEINIQGAEGAVGVRFGDGTFANTGALHVSGGDGTTVGVDFQADVFDNAGVIEVEGDTQAIGVQYSPQGYDSPSSFHNEGRISCTSGSGAGVGVQFAAPYFLDGLTLFNSGEIDADIAITGYAAFDQSITIRNSGRIVGDIDLGLSSDTVVNRGKMVGDVRLDLNDDTFDGSHGKLTGVIYGGLGDDTVIGGKGADVIFGDDATDSGQDGSDVLSGGLGNDVIHGQGGDDTLAGGAGSDILTGGYGRDVFAFTAVSDSLAEAPDVIADLHRGDRIDLSAIDANTTSDGDQAFHLVQAFTGHAGELTLSYDEASASTFIAGDVDGDGTADLVIRAIGDQSGFTGFTF